MRAYMMCAAAMALLLAVGTAGRAGEGGCDSCATYSSCCEAAPSRGLLCRTRCADSCCTPTCSGPRGVLNRRHAGDCCEPDACGKSCVRKFMEWLCYRPGRCHACKSHAPCCTPPLYTFFTCCEGEGCGSCRSYSACSSCSSCGK